MVSNPRCEQASCVSILTWAPTGIASVAVTRKWLAPQGQRTVLRHALIFCSEVSAYKSAVRSTDSASRQRTSSDAATSLAARIFGVDLYLFAAGSARRTAGAYVCIKVECVLGQLPCRESQFGASLVGQFILCKSRFR